MITGIARRLVENQETDVEAHRADRRLDAHAEAEGLRQIRGLYVAHALEDVARIGKEG